MRSRRLQTLLLVRGAAVTLTSAGVVAYRLRVRSVATRRLEDALDASKPRYGELSALLAAGASCRTRGPETGRTVLILACEVFDDTTFDRAVTAGLDPNERAGQAGWYRTALAYAASAGNLRAARILLRKGAHPNATDGEGWSPLMHAANRQDVEMVRLLLKHGAAVNQRDPAGETALYWTQGVGPAQQATVAVLLAAGRIPTVTTSASYHR